MREGFALIGGGLAGDKMGNDVEYLKTVGLERNSANRISIEPPAQDFLQTGHSILTSGFVGKWLAPETQSSRREIQRVRSKPVTESNVLRVTR